MPVILKNNASSTLTTAILAGDTALAVADGSKFPSLAAGEYFYATLAARAGTTEIIKVTARSGNSMTIVRAQDGTTASGFPVDSLLEMRVNAAAITDLADEHDQAAEISIADAGGYYTATTVEGALEEVAQDTLSRANVAALLADTALSYSNVTAGDVVRTREEGFAYKVAASGASDHHVTTAGGVKLYVLPNAGGYNVKAFGATGNGSTNDLPAIQAAIAAVKAVGGGTIHFPNGTYRVTGEILIDSPSIRFTGTGRRKVYPGLFVPSATGLPTIMPVHSGTAAVRFFNATINTASTFSAQDINFATLETGVMPTCCFGFDGSGNFHRDYTFDRVGIHGFTSAFDTYNTGGDTAFGLIKIIDCAINRNGHIARNLTGQWNGFVFEKNEAGQNLTGGLDIKAQAASIRQNSMEGQPNTIKVTGIYRGVTIAENYFELNSGDYCVQLRETSNAIIQGNYWQNITATEPLSLFACVGTRILDRIAPSCDASFDLGTPSNAIDPVPRGSATAAFFLDASMIQNNMRGLTEFGGYQVTAPAGPHFSIPNSAGFLYTTSGTGLTSATKSGLSLPADTYIGVAFAITYESEPALPPRFELRVNSTNTQGYTNAVFYNFSRATKPLKGETVLYYGVVRAKALVSTFQLLIYPYGLNPAAGLICYLSAYAMYNLGTTLPAVSNVGAAVEAFIPETHVQRVAAAPLVGTWPVGYKLHARAPAAGGFEGWICTTGGTPGTWKTFGAISA